MLKSSSLRTPQVLELSEGKDASSDVLGNLAPASVVTRKAPGKDDLGFRVQGSGFRVQGSGFRVRVQGLGFRVWGLGLAVSLLSPVALAHTHGLHGRSLFVVHL